MNSSGRIVARYVYDTWGKLISIKNENGATVSANHIGSLNPIRYRSYYYDTETGLYYLQARYYDPEVGRFISSDNIAGNTGNSTYNLFAYCANNPVNNADPSGMCVYNKGAKTVHVCKHHMENYWNPKNCTLGITYYYNGSAIFSSGIKKAPKDTTTSFSFANSITRTHVTTPGPMLDLGIDWGKIGFSSTLTKQKDVPGLFNVYSDTSFDSSSYGVGMSDQLGIGVGVNEGTSAFLEVQASSLLHGEVSLGYDGIGGVIGVDIGDMAYDFEIQCGLGPILMVGVPWVMANGGIQSLQALWAYSR